MPITENNAIHLEQLKLLYRNLKVAIPGNLFVLFAVIWASTQARSLPQSILWLSAAMLCLLALRYWDWRRFEQALQTPNSITPSFWEKRFISGIFASGVLWGLVFQLTFTPNSPEIVLFIICFYAGLTSSASATSAARFPAFIAFVLPATLPLVWRVFQAGGTLYTVMGFAFLVFVIANLIVARTYSGIIHESIRLRFENLALINSLESEKTRAETNQHIAEQAVLAKDKFLAAASHDLRQPLHAQGLYLDAIETYVHPKGVPHLQALRRTNEALANLFNSLLDVSRLNAGIVEAQPMHTALHSILRPLCEEFQTHAGEKNLSFEINCPNLTLFTDPLLLARVLRNLLANAIRYTQQGSISLHCQAADNDTVLVSVTDTGIGIPANEQANIFDEYYQLDNPERDRNKGLGLGLAIVKKLAGLLNLNVTCHSVLGQGSTFTVEIPRGDSSLLHSVQTPPTAINVSGIHVLVIDDELDILDSMNYLLNSWGCVTLLADSALQAVEKIRQSGLQPELIMADYRLRDGKTGAQAIATVRAYCQHEIPAMLITGDTSEDRLREANASGLYLLHKPVAPSRLRSVMHQLLRPLTVTP